jgi:hypothetical protein
VGPAFEENLSKKDEEFHAFVLKKIKESDE